MCIRDRSTLPSLRPIFRDREELPVSSNLSGVVQDALSQSECLIVICSENAAQSEWVNKEILLFRKLKPKAEIFPVIISGEPFAEKLGLDQQQECFPQALRYETDRDGHLTTTPMEPLAADMRKDKDGKHLGLMKLIAGIINISPDALIQRNLQRARKRVVAVTSGASAIVLTLSLLTISTLVARNAAERNALIAQEQRELAETRRDEAEGLIEFMLGDLRQELEPIGRLALLTNVADRALEYYGHVDEDLSNCRSASGAARAKYLHTRIAVSRKDYKLARHFSNEALTLLDETASECSALKQFVTNHAHALQWSADLDVIEKASDNPSANTFDFTIIEKYERARANLNKFNAEDEDTLDIRIEQVDSNILIGKYYMSVQRVEDALNQFMAAKAILQADYKTINPDQTSPTSDAYIIQDKYADVLSWVAGAYENLSKLDQATETLKDVGNIYSSLLSRTENSGKNWKARFDVIGTDYALARVLYKQGKSRTAIDILERRKDDINLLVNQDPANQNWRELQDKITNSITALKKTPFQQKAD